MDVTMCGICGVIYTGDKDLYKTTKEVEGIESDIILNAFRFGNFNKKTGQWTALTSDNDICPNCASAIDQCIEHLAGDKKIQYHKAKERKKKYFKPVISEVEKDQKEFAEGRANDAD